MSSDPGAGEGARAWGVLKVSTFGPQTTRKQTKGRESRDNMASGLHKDKSLGLYAFSIRSKGFWSVGVDGLEPPASSL